jgi:hypothetical protein
MNTNLQWDVIIVWAFFASVTLWPIIVSMLVFIAKREAIRHPLRYFVSSVFWGYVSALTIPVLVFVGYFVADKSPEEATLVSLFLTPLLIICPLLLSAFCARTCR